MHDCNKCLSRESCYHLIEFGEGPLTSCQYYKDESMYVKSPCAIGTKIYIRVRTDHIDPSQFFINTATVVGLHLRDTESRRKLKREEYLVIRYDSTRSSAHIPFSYIGKHVFFSRKEAEQGCWSPKEDM